MTNKISALLGFLAGAAIGGTAVWYLVKDRYEGIAEEEIDSVKAAYAAREAMISRKVESPTVLTSARSQQKESITEYAKRVQQEGYKEYSRTVVPESSPVVDDAPYVISPDEFGEIEEYTKVSLTYFNDGVLADEYGEVVDDVEEIIGDGLEHFGEYEDDSVFVRSDAKRCDYEVLKDLRDFDEFLDTLSPHHNKEG